MISPRHLPGACRRARLLVSCARSPDQHFRLPPRARLWGAAQQRRAPRARAWAASGEVMGEDPLCAYSRQSQMASWERTTRVLVSR